MRVEKDIMVPLGYGKFFRSEKIMGLEPVEEGRGPGHRTKVYVEALSALVIASRSEGAILGDLVNPTTPFILDIISRTLKVRGGIIAQANRYLGGFCSSQGIFPPQIIQVLLIVRAL